MLIASWLANIEVPFLSLLALTATTALVTLIFQPILLCLNWSNIKAKLLAAISFYIASIIFIGH